jgi:hypothetical protein
VNIIDIADIAVLIKETEVIFRADTLTVTSVIVDYANKALSSEVIYKRHIAFLVIAHIVYDLDNAVKVR